MIKSGTGRSTVYTIAPTYRLFDKDLQDSYFSKDVDQREGNKKFDPSILSLLESTSMFNKDETLELNRLHSLYQEKIKTLSPTLLQKEIERLTIELSWKSSQIEGNTYSLLETELLLQEKQPAEGKDKSEAVMLLNHKTTMEYLYEHRILLNPLKVAAIEDIHSLLTRELGISKNLRHRVVGITGTTYKPPDNEYQLREYLQRTCTLINSKELVYEKALLAVLMISVLQPFEDGNKRTGRITANGILIENGYCPLSYRSVQAQDYKKAMILFYEQENLAAFKKLFMEQAKFAVENYF